MKQSGWIQLVTNTVSGQALSRVALTLFFGFSIPVIPCIAGLASPGVVTRHTSNVAGIDHLATLGLRMMSWSMLASMYPVLFAKDTVDGDSVSIYDSGDPTNRDLPPLIPASRRTRFQPGGVRNLTKPHGLPSGYTSKTTVDSAGKIVIQHEYMDNVAVGVPAFWDLDGYLAARKIAIETRDRDSTAQHYEIKKPLSAGELTKLLDQATNLTIPLPPNPIFGIFGKPEISINVNGEVNVQAGWRWDSQNRGTASVLGQTQSSPIFNQNVQVNVGARIGDKLRFNVDWNTLNQFEFQNRFRIGFEGYDDDIIKRVEFGNVNLETPSTLIGGGQALFGVRADFQFGPLFLKTIASQRRGERRFVDARGGTSRQFVTLRAYDYARNHFFLDTAYFQVWRDYFRSATPIPPSNAAHLVVGELEVWESTPELRDVQASEAVAIDTLPPIAYGQRYAPAIRNQRIQVGYTERGRFMKLDQRRYEFDPNLGTLTILNLRTDRTYAVAYRVEGPTSSQADDLYFGTLSRDVGERDTLVLKLIATRQMQPGFRNIWKRQMRNRYNLGLANVNPADSKINMWYFQATNDSGDVLRDAPDKLVTIFRIDQVNNGTGAAPPDGIFDARPPVFNPTRGEITFPSIEPFRDGLREYFRARGNEQVAEKYVFSEVYDTTEQAARLNSAKDRFVIVGEGQGGGGGSNRIPLNFNTAPGSVRVSLDGVPLREGVDYTVDYYQGFVSMMNPRATLPNANLRVEFEQNDIFNTATKTMAGVRADLLLFNKRKVSSSIGMTMLNYSQAAIIDRVPIGQEPNANFMVGFDAKLDAELDWMTRALDALPFFDTKERSTFTMRGEWALTAPTPNKRFSTVCSDNGKAVAYVDDFEAARRYLPFGLTPAVWSHSSAPLDEERWPNDTTAQYYRGRTFWYQFFIPQTPQVEVYPKRARIIGRSNINDMRITFDPDFRGIYNRNPEFLDAGNPLWFSEDSNSIRSETGAWQAGNRDKVWGGMMRLLSTFNTNFDNENIDYIEVMMHIDEYEPGSRMYIDLGMISEDVIPNQILDTEDNPPPNNLIDEGEDRGLDRIFNEEERVEYPYPLNIEEDPARDDYLFDFTANRNTQAEGDFVRYNNHEGNALQSELGQFPDTEILNRNNGQTLQLDNSYFRYEIKINPNPTTNPQIVGGNPTTGWFQYRIPVRRPDTIVGNPLFTNVQYVRVSFRGGRVKLKIADWGLIGSFWLRAHNLQEGLTIADSVLEIAYVNREENSDAPDYYTEPPCVTPPRQLNNPDPNQDIFFNEQSLVVRVRNLRYGEERMAARILRPLDMFYYKQIAFFIHGDETMPQSLPTGMTPPAFAFFRFGIDSANYYEYRRPLLRGWQDIHIILSELTAIKQVRDVSRRRERQEFPAPGDPQAMFAIKGDPILTRVLFVGFGVANPAERYPNELTTSLWCNELRLVEPVDDNDWAGVGGATLKLADLGDITVGFNHQQPNFHRLEERFGDRVESTNWNVTANMGLEKFLPKELKGAKIPVTYTHAEFFRNPQFQAQNDVELQLAAEAARADTLRKGASRAEADAVARDVRERSEGYRVQDQFALTGIRIPIPVNHWLIDDTFNKITWAFNYAQEFERSQVVAQKFTWSWDLKADYAVSIPALLSFSPLKFLSSVPGLSIYRDMKISLLPNSLNAGVALRRGRITEQSRFLDFPSPVVREFTSTKTMALVWKFIENGFLSPTFDYKVMGFSTLVPFELDLDGQQRTGSDLFGRMLFSNGALLDLGVDSRLEQTVTIAMRPRLPEIAGINKFVETTASYTTNYQWFDPLQDDPEQRDLVKVAKYNATMRVSPVLRWRQIGNEIFGAKKKGDSTFGAYLQEIFFGFENLTLAYNNTSNSTNPGVYGGTGFSNLWARTLTFRENRLFMGPSVAYQLGFVSNPHGEINLVPSSSFPFFGFATTPGLRPPNGVMQDNYSEKNAVQFQTSRPLWTGATLDLTMKSDFGYTRDQRVVTNAAGMPEFTNINIRQTLDRSFISFPNWFGFGLFNNSVENVAAIYAERKTEIDAVVEDTAARNFAYMSALADAFREGFESFQFWSGEMARIMPALNWAIRWDGLEKWSLLKGVAQRIYLEHTYQSSYQENARVNNVGRTIDVQQISTGFQPLIGITMNFDEKLLKGVLTATARYNTRNMYSLSGAARTTISRELQDEIQIQASYLRRGVALKFLGFQMENDIEFSFMTQVRKSKRAQYNILDITNTDGALVDGTTTIVIEPRARYTISNRVTASAFLRHEANINEGAAQGGFSTTQVGMDIRLSISGGR